MSIIAVRNDGVIGWPAGRLNSVVAKIGERSEVVLRREIWRKPIHQRHGCREVETTRSTSSNIMVVHREVAIAVRIGTRGSDV